MHTWGELTGHMPSWFSPDTKRHVRGTWNCARLSWPSHLTRSYIYLLSCSCSLDWPGQPCTLCVPWLGAEDAEGLLYLSYIMLFLLMLPTCGKACSHQAPVTVLISTSTEVTGSARGHVQHFPWLASELRSSQASASRAFTQSYLLSPPTLTLESTLGLGFKGVCHYTHLIQGRARSQSFRNAGYSVS